MEKNNELPSSWEICKIDNITKSRKIGIDRSRREQFDHGIPYLKMNNITINGTLDLASIVHIQCGKEEKNNYLLEHGDIIFNTRNSYELVGKTAFWNNDIQDCVYNNNIMRLRIHDGILPKFLVYFMNSNQFKNSLLSIKRSTTNICAIYDKDLKEQLIPVPPLNEQKRIINKIEKLFLELDDAKSILKKVKLRLVQHRQSLLKSAFENKEWDNIRLGDYLTLEYGKSLIKKDRKKGSIPVYGSSGIGGYHDKALVERSSLIIGRKGNAGNVMLVEQPFWAIDTTYFLKETKDYNLKFLYYLFKHLNLGKLDSSTTIPSLRRDDVHAQNIPLPKIKEQNETISEIEQGFSLTENIENITNSMLKQINILHSGILKQAFEGKLVPQDPNDESASELLKRIKSQN